jgi:hypothetical protein
MFGFSTASLERRYFLDIERFTRLVTDHRRTKDELQNMLRNALNKGETEFAHIVKDQLDVRFPGWDCVRSRKGGSTPTVVAFRGIEYRFETAKKAYFWLIEKFLEAHPEPFVTLNWETKFIAKGKRRNYFGRNLEKMFHGSPHLADDPNNYQKLSNGWYANLNLNNDQKFDILCKFAAVGEFDFGREWKWEIEGKLSGDELDSSFML